MTAHLGMRAARDRPRKRLGHGGRSITPAAIRCFGFVHAVRCSAAEVTEQTASVKLRGHIELSTKSDESPAEAPQSWRSDQASDSQELGRTAPVDPFDRGRRIGLKTRCTQEEFPPPADDCRGRLLVRSTDGEQTDGSLKPLFQNRKFGFAPETRTSEMPAERDRENWANHTDSSAQQALRESQDRAHYGANLRKCRVNIRPSQEPPVRARPRGGGE